MKTTIAFVSALLFSTTLFCQLTFAPLGATWMEHYECDPGGPPPMAFSFTVTQDSTIQGKYCTRLLSSDWPCYQGTSPYMYVYFEDGKVYRWEHESSEFHLVLDFTKEEGESWRIPVCEGVFGSDSATITVNQRDGIYRNVSAVADAGGSNDLFNLDLYEGLGGTIGNRLLLFPLIWAQPACWTDLTCYEDPMNGLLYGSPTCFTGTRGRGVEPFELSVSPNSTAGDFTIDLILEESAVVRLSIIDQLGRVIETIGEEKLSVGQHQFRQSLDLPTGLYLLHINVDGLQGARKMLVK